MLKNFFKPEVNVHFSRPDHRIVHVPEFSITITCTLSASSFLMVLTSYLPEILTRYSTSYITASRTYLIIWQLDSNCQVLKDCHSYSDSEILGKR